MFLSSRTSRLLAVVVTAVVLPLMPSPPLRSGAGLSQHCAPDSRLLRCAPDRSCHGGAEEPAGLP